MTVRELIEKLQALPQDVENVDVLVAPRIYASEPDAPYVERDDLDPEDVKVWL